MRATRIIRSLLAPCAEFLHQYTLAAAVRGCEALQRGGQLGVTALGRAAAGTPKAKHRIKAADRLAGNRRLLARFRDVYRALAQRWLGLSGGTPVILVDWSGLKNGFHVLSAAVAFQGRSIPLYAEVHPEKKLANRRVEAHFLRHLKDVLPSNCTPIIVADAGFYTEWCDAVEDLGWYFVTRVRNKTMYQPRGSNDWVAVKSVHHEASHTPRSRGWVRLTKTKPRRRRLILFRKRKASGRPRSRGRCTTANKHRKQASEPWVLATNLTATPRRIVNIYKRRMQIEQNYRDLKDTRWGWGLEHCRSRSAARFAILILLATIVMFAVLLTGFVAEQQKLHYEQQANTIRRRRVLSLFFLGNRILSERRGFHIAPLGDKLRQFAAEAYCLES